MATHLTPAEMKRVVIQHFEDFVNLRRADVIHRNMTPDFLDHDGPEGRSIGTTGDETMMRLMYEKMPDLHIDILDCLADGDKVACRNIWRWTDTASAKKMQFHGFVLWRFEGDKIAERWATVTTPEVGSEWSAGQSRS
jgi:predicted ester cyclase